MNDNLTDNVIEMNSDGTVMEPGTELARVADQPVSMIDPDTPAEVKALHQKVLDLRDQIDETYMELSEVLYQIWDESLYHKMGYKTFREYVEEACDFKIRKAQYLVQIWNWIGDLNDETRDKLFHVGWSKLKELVGIVNDENVDEWVQVAMDSSLYEMIEKARAQLGGGEGGEGGTPGTGDPGFKNMNFRLPLDQHELVVQALEKAQEMAQSDKKSYLLGLVCQDFLTSNASPTGEQAIRGMLKRIEGLTGMRLVALSADYSSVVFGQETIDNINGAGE